MTVSIRDYIDRLRESSAAERRLRENELLMQAHLKEAQLKYLQAQINPHFLFNTLNNISSLTQIDPDATQDAIAQLSDLLRYAMYETNKKTVPIQGEIEFMRNYISLMKLRCNEKTEVNTTFDVQQNIEIAPLLFILICLYLSIYSSNEWS